MELDDSKRRSDNFSLKVVLEGVFCPAADGSSREGGKEKRVMQGELEVKRSFKPTCLFPKFATRVSVVWRFASHILTYCLLHN